MFAFVRLMFICFIVMTLIYIGLSFYSRAVRRGKLKAEWQEGPQDVDRDLFVEAGLEQYDKSLRRKLILGVYVVPIVVIGTIVYLTNHG